MDASAAAWPELTPLVPPVAPPVPIAENGLSAAELAGAVDAFRRLLDPDTIHARQPAAPEAVYTPYVVVWLLIVQRLLGNASLAQAVAHFLEHLSIAPENRRVTEQTLSAATGAYSRARTRLPPEVAETVADEVGDSLLQSTPPAWQNRRVFLFDGTTSPLSPQAALRQAYPPASNQHGTSVWPILHWAVAHELASGVALRPETGAMYGPEAVSEVTLAQRLLPRLPAGAVLMADRNFGVFAFVHAAHAAGHDVVARLTQSRFAALQRRAQPDGPGRWTLAWQPTTAERTKHPELPADAVVPIVLHEVVGTAAPDQPVTLWIVTTLATDGAALAELYHRRQDVETDIKNVKVALQMNAFRGQSVAMLRKELALGITAYNLVIQIRRLAAKQAGVPPRKLSFTGAWTLVQTLLLQSSTVTLEEYTRKFLQVLRGCGQRKLPHRPQRQYPRQILPRGRKFPHRPRNSHPPNTM